MTKNKSRRHVVDDWTGNPGLWIQLALCLWGRGATTPSEEERKVNNRPRSGHPLNDSHKPEHPEDSIQSSGNSGSEALP